MGGKDGSRGYLYQALVAVLDAIENDDWAEVYLEYETDNDKVDIAFKDSNGKLEVIQVKSSINNFSKADINKWLIEIIQDKPDANKFRLELIGIGESKTTEYINSIKKLSKDKCDKTSDKIKTTIPELIMYNIDKVDINISNNEIKSFENNISVIIHELLYKNGYIFSPIKLKDIVGAITYQFNRLCCTDEEFISRDEFIENILSWAINNYKLDKGNSSKRYFEVQYYHDNQFFDKLDSDIRIDVKKEDEKVEKIKLEIKNICDVIKGIDIKYEQEMKLIYQLNPINIFVAGMNARFGTYTKVSIKHDMVSDIKQYLKAISYPITDEFFDLKDLEKSNGFSDLKPKELKGHSLLKKKYELIEELHYYINYINKYNDFRAYLVYLASYKIVPLCLKNISGKYMENIIVNLKIPKNLDVLTSTNIETPNLKVIKDIENFIEKNMIGKKDSNIDEFYGKYVYKNSALQYFKSDEEKFRESVEDMFEYEVFNNEKDYIILQCNFKKLNPHDAMYLPMHLMIKSEDEFEIEYSIKCKNMSKIQTGKIKA